MLLVLPQPKQIIQANPQPTKIVHPYIPKPKPQQVIQMKVEFWDENLEKIYQKFFLKNSSGDFWHFVLDAPKNINQFYKLILHDSKLVKLLHNIDPKNDAHITHST